MNQLIYFDNAATTSIDPKVVEAMLPYLSEHYGNPSSTYSIGRTTRAAIEAARHSIAQILNVQTSEIVFTSCGTEANNMALKGAVIYHQVNRIITSRIEHHCVLHTVEYLEQYHQVKIDYVNVSENGEVDLNHLEELLKADSHKTLVSLMHVNNELGTILDIKKVGDLCKAYNAMFHADTVQSFAHFPLDLQSINVDFITCSAHKFHGPKGAGFLFHRKKSKVASFVHGGGQERGYRAGTENVYGIVGLVTAAQIALEHLEKDSTYIRSIKTYFWNKLQTEFNDIGLNGNLDNCSYTILNVSFPNWTGGDMLLFNLDLEGVCVSGGSACSSGAASGSHVINTIKPNSDRINVRFSFSKHNTTEEVDKVIEILKKYINQ